MEGGELDPGRGPGGVHPVPAVHQLPTRRDYVKALNPAGRPTCCGVEVIPPSRRSRDPAPALTAIEWPEDELSVFATLRDRFGDR